MKIAVLVSGGLGFSVLKQINAGYQVVCVLTDSNSFAIIDYCKNNEIPFFKGNPRNGKGFDFIKSFHIDVLASINYLFLIEDDIINHPKEYAFNIHGSLLPKYRGRTPHVWAIINNEDKTGITAHLIEKGCDTGPIISQIEIPIEENDTGATVLDKYAEVYYPLVERVLLTTKKKDLTLIPQDNLKATYFGKRTPNDGKIKWDWSKERIYNWVRAQANPYPGAFSFYDGEKVIIDRISFTDTGFHYKDDNGLIIANQPKILIKTSNGVVALESIRTEKKLTFEVGKKLKEC